MDVEVVELGEANQREKFEPEVGSWGDGLYWLLGEGKMEGSDGGERERGEELGQSRGSRGVWEREVVDVSGSVDEWSDELEEGEVDEGERCDGWSVGVGEVVEEELGREARHVQGSVGRGD
jgi:hypothetical protein